MSSGAARVATARDAVTAAAASRWRLRDALLEERDPSPVVSSYLVGKDVVFEAVHHVSPDVEKPFTAWLSGTQQALTALGAGVVEPRGDAGAVVERLGRHRRVRGTDAVNWFARLAAHEQHGGRAGLGVRVDEVCVRPASRIRRAGAIVDVVDGRSAALGHRDRLVLARVRCRTAESAATLYREVHLDFRVDVDVLGPVRGDEAATPLLERMAMVEDYLYLAAVRLGKTTGS